MSFKTILVPTEQHDLMASTLETALVLARQFESYIEGFALRPTTVDILTMDFGSAMPVAEVKEYDMKVVKEAHDAFESFMQERGVARGDPAGSNPAFGWLEDAPDGDGFVGSYGRVFDVTVIGRPGGGTRSPRMITLEASLFESGRPALIAPPTPPQRIGENILIAWNRSTEQSRTTAFAMPLLRKASRVTVVTVEGGTDHRSARRTAGPLPAAQWHPGGEHQRECRQPRCRRGGPEQGAGARLRPLDQGRLYPEPAAPDDLWRCDPLFAGQHDHPDADGALRAS